MTLTWCILVSVFIGVTVKERVEGRPGNASSVVHTKYQTKTEAVIEGQSQLTTGPGNASSVVHTKYQTKTEAVTEGQSQLTTGPGNASSVVHTKYQTKTEAVTEGQSQLTTGPGNASSVVHTKYQTKTEAVTEDHSQLTTGPGDASPVVHTKHQTKTEAVTEAHSQLTTGPGDASPVVHTKHQTKTEAVTEAHSQLTTRRESDDFENITAIHAEQRVTEDPHQLVSFPAEENEDISSFLISHTGGILEGCLATFCVVLLVVVIVIIKRRNRTRVMLIRKPEVTGLRPYEPKRRHEARVPARLRSRKVLPDLPEVPSHTKHEQPPDTTRTQNLYHSLIFNIPRKQLSSTSRASSDKTWSLLSVNSNYVTAIASPKEAVNSVNEISVDPYDTIEGLGMSTLVCQANDNHSTVVTSISPTSRDQIISTSSGYSDVGDFSPKLENDNSELVQPTYYCGNAVSDKSIMPQPKVEKPIRKSNITALVTQAKQTDNLIVRTNSDVMETKV